MEPLTIMEDFLYLGSTNSQSNLFRQSLVISFTKHLPGEFLGDPRDKMFGGKLRCFPNGR